MATKKKKREDGRYEATVTIGYDKDGNRVRKHIYADSQTELNRRKEELQKLADTTNYCEISVADWLDEWLNVIIKDTIRDRSWEEYETLCRRHIKPSLGIHQLHKLQPHHIRRLLAQKKDEGLSPRRIQYIYVTINAALKQALKDRILIYNPCAAVDKPTVDQKDIVPISDQDFNRLLEESKKSLFHALYALAWATGMRLGEILGLRWQDVDFKKNTISVNQSVSRSKAKGVHISSKLKSKSAYRTLPVPKEVMTILHEHKVHQNEHRLSTGLNYQSQYDLAFPKQDGTPKDPSDISNHFRGMITDLKLKKGTRFHDIRHTHATMLAEMGEHPKKMQIRLGHATAAFTMDKYTHDTEKMQEGIAGKLSERWNQKAAKN